MDPSVVQSVVPSKPIKSNVPSDGLRLLSEQHPNSELWKVCTPF
ncbi:hypothetical protein Hanom_Chr05g00401301 [Helianthus anomalus]